MHCKLPQSGYAKTSSNSNVENSRSTQNTEPSTAQELSLAQDFEQQHRYKEAHDIYEKHAREGLGNPKAAYLLGLMYKEGRGEVVEKNFDQAHYWLKKGSEQGYSAASFHLANLHYYDEQGDKSEAEERYYAVQRLCGYEIMGGECRYPVLPEAIAVILKDFEQHKNNPFAMEIAVNAFGYILENHGDNVAALTLIHIAEAFIDHANTSEQKIDTQIARLVLGKYASKFIFSKTNQPSVAFTKFQHYARQEFKRNPEQANRDYGDLKWNIYKDNELIKW